MDPISAIIGAGASLIGGFMNTSSQQAINQANIAEQQWSAQGGYLPGLVANAERAGLSPLAVLGQRGPNMAVQVSGEPGGGLMVSVLVVSLIGVGLLVCSVCCVMFPGSEKGGGDCSLASWKR